MCRYGEHDNPEERADEEHVDQPIDAPYHPAALAHLVKKMQLLFSLKRYNSNSRNFKRFLPLFHQNAYKLHDSHHHTDDDESEEECHVSISLAVPPVEPPDSSTNKLFIVNMIKKPRRAVPRPE